MSTHILTDRSVLCMEVLKSWWRVAGSFEGYPRSAGTSSMSERASSALQHSTRSTSSTWQISS